MATYVAESEVDVHQGGDLNLYVRGNTVRRTKAAKVFDFLLDLEFFECAAQPDGWTIS